MKMTPFLHPDAGDPGVPVFLSPRAALLAAARELQAAGVPDPAYDAAALLSAVTGEPPLLLRMETEKTLTEAQERSFRALMDRRLAREPLQHLLGTVPFCSLTFRVSPDALIPRPETELLAEWALEELASAGLPSPAVLDLCCGTGCIGLTVGKRMPACRLTLTDLSEGALALASENARLLGVSARFLRGDLWEPIGEAAFDLIVSNPPYIPSAECDSLQPEVMREPRMALDGGADGLDFYRRIARDASAHLNPGGRILLEAGFGEAKAVAALLEAAGAESIGIRADDAGIDRMILARWP